MERKAVSGIMLALFLISMLSLAFNITSVSAEYVDVDLSYLVIHIAEFEGLQVRTSGTVKYYFSFYMHEDFWLEAPDRKAIPVEVSTLPLPPENTVIIVEGTVVWHDLERGFYSIHADSWELASYIVGDLDHDGKVDIRDIALVAKYFGQTVPPAPPNCDITGSTGVPDGKIDIRDIGMVAKNFGKTCI